MNKGVERTCNERLWPSLRNRHWLLPEEHRENHKVPEDIWYVGRGMNSTPSKHKSAPSKPQKTYLIFVNSTEYNFKYCRYNVIWSHAESCLFSYMLLMSLLDCRTTDPRIGKIWKANLDTSEDKSVSVGDSKNNQESSNRALYFKLMSYKWKLTSIQ